MSNPKESNSSSKNSMSFLLKRSKSALITLRIVWVLLGVFVICVWSGYVQIQRRYELFALLSLPLWFISALCIVVAYIFSNIVIEENDQAIQVSKLEAVLSFLPPSILLAIMIPNFF